MKMNKMKTLKQIAVAGCLISSFILHPSSLPAGTAVITLLDFQSNPLPNEKCVLTFFSAPQSQYSGTSVQWRNSFFSDANGQICLTNAAPGKWMVSPADPNAVSFTFSMPATNGTVYAQYYTTASAGNTLPPGTMSYDINASDLRYLQVANFPANIITNGGIQFNYTGGDLDIGNAGNPTDTNVVRIGDFQTDTYLAGNVHGTFTGDFSGNSAQCNSYAANGFDPVSANGNWHFGGYVAAAAGITAEAGSSFSGNGIGLTNIQSTAITGGLNLIVTNMWSPTITNRLYFTNGILVRFTSP